MPNRKFFNLQISFDVKKTFAVKKVPNTRYINRWLKK